MLKNYLKIGWRSLKKDKTFSILNIVGLTVAFAVAILLSMAAIFELSYDDFHEKGDSLYQVYSVQQTPKGPDAGTARPTPFAEALQKEVPGIKQVTRYLQDGTLVFYNQKEINTDVVWVDANFFSMFTFPNVKGDATNPLQELLSVVITHNMANRLFADADPIGKTVHLLINGEEKPFTVASVVEDIKSNSSIEFEMAVRFENSPYYEETKSTWDSQFHDVYVELDKGVTPAQFTSSAKGFAKLHHKQSIEDQKRDGALANADGSFYNYHVLPIKDLNYVNFQYGFAEVKKTMPYLVLGIAFLILFIACVNFINMTIAKSNQRLLEIGMRKTLGAEKKQLFFQFWIESFILFVISATLGIILSVLLLHQFQTLFNTDANFNNTITPFNATISVLAVIAVTLLVGGYPAAILGKLGTLQALKGKLENSGKNYVRNGLMVLQFSITILLISGTLVLWSQIDFMRNKDLGYNKDQVLAFVLNGKMDSYKTIDLLRQELAGNPDIKNISAADNILGMGKDGSQMTSKFGFEYKGRIVQTNQLIVDYDYVETLGLKLTSGRNFSRDYPNDNQTVVINESMAKLMGEKNPLTGYISFNDSLRYPVIGVVKDYNFQKLTNAIEPLTFFMDRDNAVYYAYVNVASTNMAKSYDAVKEAYQTLEPNAQFLGSFLNENIDRTFKKEKLMATLITSGSTIAIVLSCIGLFAISLLIVNLRTKEIGVRKVVGASIFSLTFMLTKDFLKLVCVAFVIATPIAWWFMKQWLEGYTYKMELNIWVFALAGFIVLLIAALTAATRTIKAAMQNPVDSLRSE